MKNRHLLLLTFPVLLSGCHFVIPININGDDIPPYEHEIFLRNQFKIASEEADKLFYDIEDIYTYEGEIDYDHLEEAKKNKPNKFFIVLTQNNCLGCDLVEEAFRIIKDNPKDFAHEGDIIDSGEADEGDQYLYWYGVQLATIYVDEVDKEGNSLFIDFVERHPYFFERAAERGYRSAYYSRGGLSSSQLDVIGNCDYENMVTPTLFMVDLEDYAQPGVRDLIVGTDGDPTATAHTLVDCWYQEGQFLR